MKVTPVHDIKIEIVRGWRGGSVGKVACYEVRILVPTKTKGQTWQVVYNPRMLETNPGGALSKPARQMS